MILSPNLFVAWHVYHPLFVDNVSEIERFFPLFLRRLVPFPLYHLKSGGGLPSMGQGYEVRLPSCIWWIWGPSLVIYGWSVQRNRDNRENSWMSLSGIILFVIRTQETISCSPSPFDIQGALRLLFRVSWNCLLKCNHQQQAVCREFFYAQN